MSAKLDIALGDELDGLVEKYPDRSLATRYGKELDVVVDHEKARFSSWYEMFPRSSADQPGKHGTFSDCERLLPYVASMGFDTLYFRDSSDRRTHRKGRITR